MSVSIRRLLIALVAVTGALAGLAALPGDVHACAMCFSGPAESRKAFAVTAAFLTVLPLGMLAGATAWLRGKARAAEAESSAADQTGSEPTSL